MPAGFCDGGVEAYGGQRILQPAPLAHVHVNITTRDERQPELMAKRLECAQPLLVGAVDKQLDGNTDLGPKAFTQPLRLFLQGACCRYPENETLLEARGRHGLPGEGISSLAGCAPPAADQAAKPAVAVPIDRDRDKLQPTLEAELGPDQQLQLQQLRCHVCPYNPGNGTLISDGERAISQGTGTFYEFLWVRSSAQESKVADAMQFSVGRQRGYAPLFGGVAAHGEPCSTGVPSDFMGGFPHPRQRTPLRLGRCMRFPQTTPRPHQRGGLPADAHPNTPCRNHRCGSARSRNIHS